MSGEPRHFIIGGAQRSATTFLMQMLDAHPAIEMAKPFRPEPKVFIGGSYSDLTYETYLSRYFSGQGDAVKWLGEKSTSYIEYEDIPERLTAFFNRPKIMFALRDPIERAISNYHFSRMHGYETDDINVALLREIDAPETVRSSTQTGISVSPQAYLARGRYVDFLKAFFSQFPAEDILLIHSERLTSEQAERERVFEFLGLKDASLKTTHERINASAKDTDQSLGQDVRDRLSAYFKESNAALRDIYNFDISSWG